PPTCPYAVRKADDLDHIMDTIEAAIRDTNPSRVVIDSMEFLADRFPKEDVFRRWIRLLELGRTHGAIVSYLFLNWTFDEADMQRVNAISDYIVEFQTKMRTGVLEHFMRIREKRPGGVATGWIPFTFSEFAGLKVYFPRILVTGPYHAGKSTVVRALCGNAVNVERMGTTVAFDYGNVQMSGLEAEVFGTPGQERFEFIFSIFAREVSGVLLVIDSTRREDFPRARQMLDLLGPKVPVVVLANKSDLPNGMSEGEIRDGLNLPAGVPILRTVANEGVGVREGLLRLADRILGGS
ncbi:MAG: ADP-ribosylation factor-like protein, partial [Candidatus Thermoplasmatota archaeon]